MDYGTAGLRDGPSTLRQAQGSGILSCPEVPKSRSQNILQLDFEHLLKGKQG